tara:strand:- start:13868 stop:15550 length:1683 start_codon:yes stop_codon:yes gene_type:complete
MKTNENNITLRIAIAQQNPIVGNIAGNLDLVLQARDLAKKNNADLIIFSELFLSGYPPEDLVLRPAFIQEINEALESLKLTTADGGPGILIGLPTISNGNIYNSAALIDNNEIVAIQNKVHLPNYDVFDEARVFSPGEMPGPINFRGQKIGVAICEDIWFEDVVECLTETGAEMLIVLNGSPYSRHKHDIRQNVAMKRVVESKLPLIYVNQIGGQDELVFEGGSFIINSNYSVPIKLPNFIPSIKITNWSKKTKKWVCLTSEENAEGEELENIYSACVLGLKDYVLKNNFSQVIIGLSGGIDSALVACIAADALGPSNVHCIMLPSIYTSDQSIIDAELCAKNLNIKVDSISITEIVDVMERQLNPFFSNLPKDLTEENIQSRTRGLLLMALSNKYNKLLLTTGNKSEMAVGYATLYGDMSGAFNPIKDIYKTEVFELAKTRNASKPVFALGPSGIVIPENIITKAPSAELRENQTDQDSLPDYKILDDILYKLIEEELSVKDIIGSGYDPKLVSRIQNLLYISEYKRRQAPPGVKISYKNFGKDRRYPITNNYRDRSVK